MEKIALTMAQAADISGVSVRTLYILISAGKLRSTTVGRRRLVLYDSLKKLLTTSAVPARPVRHE